MRWVMPEVLVAVISCPGCGTELEGTWAAPEEPEDVPELERQLCGSCGSTWTAEWPGFSFRTEA
jgi:hypothetical protein